MPSTIRNGGTVSVGVSDGSGVQVEVLLGSGVAVSGAAAVAVGAAVWGVRGERSVGWRGRCGLRGGAGGYDGSEDEQGEDFGHGGFLGDQSLSDFRSLN